MLPQNDESDSEGGSESCSASSGVEDVFYDKHSCTDIPCAVLFLAAVCFFAYVFLWGEWNGDLKKMSHGIDRHGMICGVSANVSDKPFMYYCPQQFDFTNFTWQLEVEPQDPICVSACPQNSTEGAVMVSDCPASQKTPYSSKLVAQWYCLPDDSALAKAQVKFDRRINSLSQGSSDGFGLLHGWPVMLLVVFVATVLGYLYLFMLRLLAKGLIWVCVLLSIVALIGAGCYLWVQGASALDADSELTAEQQGNLDLGAKALGVFFWVSAFLVSCLGCCCAGEIGLSTACIQQGSQVIWKMPLLLCAPLAKAVAKATLALTFFFGFMRLWSTAEVTGMGTTRYYHFSFEQKLYLCVFVAVGMWILETITALYQFSIAYAVAKYYHTPKDDEGDRDVDCLGVLEGLKAGLFFHLGSLALGSAIITALEIVQKLLAFAELKNKEEGNNQVVSCILSSLLCCCYCVEGVVQFISKNAYIDIAISSTGFCHAVRNVGRVMLDHGAAMAVLNGATMIFQIVGMVAITLVCGLMSYVLLEQDMFSQPTSSYFVPNRVLATAVACILALIVSWAFMTVFDMATDTLLFCLSLDIRKNGTAVNADDKMKDLFEQARFKADKLRRKETEKAEHGAKIASRKK